MRREIIWIILSVFSSLLYGLLKEQKKLAESWFLNSIQNINTILITVTVIQIILFVVFEVYYSKSQKQRFSQIFEFIISVLIYGAAAIVILKYVFKQDIKSVLTTSAVLTAVIGLALQATLGNLFAGIAMQLERPYYVGDEMRFNNLHGTIENLTWRSIIIRTIRNELISIPNNFASSNLIKIFPLNREMKRDVRVISAIQEPPEKIKKIIKETICHIPNLNSDRKIEVLQVEPNYQIICNEFIVRYTVKENRQQFQTDSQIRTWIWYAFARHNIKIPLYSQEALSEHNLEQSSNIDLNIFNGIKTYSTIKINTKKYAYHALRLLNKHSLFTDFEYQKIAQVLDRSTLLTYALGEKFYTQNTNLYLIVKGSGLAELLHTQANWHKSLASLQKNDKLIDTEELEKLEQKLYYYCGPIAKLLLNRALEITTISYYLYQILAQEIDNNFQRKAFLKDCPQAPTQIVSKGTIITKSPLFSDDGTQKTNCDRYTCSLCITPSIKVVEELVILEIPKSSILYIYLPTINFYH